MDSLYPSVYSPVAFLRTFAAAEQSHGRPPPFSDKARGVLDAVEQEYRRE